jgi:hypothetical protein
MNKATAELIRPLGQDRAGVITTKEAVAARLDPALPSREVLAGRWQRLAPGIYLPTAEPADEQQRVHAASLHAGPLGVITGRAGCALRGVRGFDATSGPVTVLIPHAVRRVSEGFVTLVRTRELPAWHVLRREGHADLRVAEKERCVADAIREEVDLAAARALAARAARDHAVDWAKVADAVRPGPGSGHLKRVVRDIADGIRSPAEGQLNDVLLKASRRGQLPPYLLNPDVYLDGVLIGSPDAWFVGLGLGDEQDSREWHGSEDGLDSTLLRHERFRRAGLHLNHTTPSRFSRDPRSHVLALQVLIAERRALDVPEPPGLVVLGRGPLLPARTPWPQVLPSRPR